MMPKTQAASTIDLVPTINVVPNVDVAKLEERIEKMRKQHMEELKMQQSDFNLKLLKAQA